jgi:hypothetical protein
VVRFFPVNDGIVSPARQEATMSHGELGGGPSPAGRPNLSSVDAILQRARARQGRSPGLGLWVSRDSPELRREEHCRKRRYRWWAAALAVGFFLPIIVADSGSWIQNIVERVAGQPPAAPAAAVEGEGEPPAATLRLVFLQSLIISGPAPFALKWLVFYPLLAAVALALATGLPSALRALAAIVLGLIPVLVCMGAPEVKGLMDPLASATQAAGPACMVLAVLGGLGILVGSLARTYRPGSTAAFVIGVCGGAMTLLALVLPLSPEGGGRIMLLAPLKMMEQAGAGKFVAVIQAGEWVCLILASLLCFANHYKLEAGRAGSRGYRALGFLAAGLLLAASAQLFAALGAGGGLPVPTLLTLFPKMTVLVFGLVLLAPLGLADLVAGFSSAAPLPVEPEPVEAPVERAVAPRQLAPVRAPTPPRAPAAPAARSVRKKAPAPVAAVTEPPLAIIVEVEAASVPEVAEPEPLVAIVVDAAPVPAAVEPPPLPVVELWQVESVPPPLPPPLAAAEPSPPPLPDARTRLQTLHSLKEAGLITDEDFEAKKKDILDSL